jgi:hypothetical protein
MKVAKTLLVVTLSIHAVSAFGLHTAASNAVKSMSKPPPSPFRQKSMVQPVDIHGNRLSSIVSTILLIQEEYGDMSVAKLGRTKCQMEPRKAWWSALGAHMSKRTRNLSLKSIRRYGFLPTDTLCKILPHCGLAEESVRLDAPNHFGLQDAMSRSHSF